MELIEDSILPGEPFKKVLGKRGRLHNFGCSLGDGISCATLGNAPQTHFMAVAIRLRREGNRNRPFYRIVVADSRSRRDGRFIEMIGTYDPQSKDAVNYKLDVGKADEWISKGAQASDTVRSLIKKARKAGPVVKEAPAAEEAPAAVDAGNEG